MGNAGGVYGSVRRADGGFLGGDFFADAFDSCVVVACVDVDVLTGDADAGEDGVGEVCEAFGEVSAAVGGCGGKGAVRSFEWGLRCSVHSFMRLSIESSCG